MKHLTLLLSSTLVVLAALAVQGSSPAQGGYIPIVHTCPSEAEAGDTVTCSVTVGLGSGALRPPTDFVVALSTSHPGRWSSFPSSVTIPAGYDSATYQATLAADAPAGNVTNTATANNVSKHATIGVVRPLDPRSR